MSETMKRFLVVVSCWLLLGSNGSENENSSSSFHPLPAQWRNNSSLAGKVQWEVKDKKLYLNLQGPSEIRSELLTHIRGGNFPFYAEIETNGNFSKLKLIIQSLKVGYEGLDWQELVIPTPGTPKISTQVNLNPQSIGVVFHIHADGNGRLIVHRLLLGNYEIIATLHPSAIVPPADYNPEVDSRRIEKVGCRLLDPTLYQWGHVIVGGGGTVRMVQTHPKDGTIAIGADVAGIFYWERKEERFRATMDFLGPQDYGLFHTDAFVFHPTNSDILYFVGGKEWRSGSGVLTTQDRGKTWKKYPLLRPDGKPVFISNGSTERRLSVDPQNGSILWYGSRRDGLYRSLDGGQTWKVVPIEGIDWDKLSVQWILPVVSRQPSTRTETLFAAFSPTSKEIKFDPGIYRSNDFGQSWQKTDLPFARLATLSPDSTLLFLSDKKVWKVNLQTGTIEDITPLDLTTTNGRMWDYSPVAVSPENNQWIVTFTRSFRDGAFFRSRDGGRTWERFNNEEHHEGKRLIYQHSPYEAYVGGGCHVFNGIWDVVFDPVSPRQVWIAFWPGVLRSPDIWATPVVFQAVTNGHEEVCVFDLTTPSQGAPLISGLMDVGGFVHWELDQQPKTTMKGVGGPEGPHGQTVPLEVTSLDFCESVPSFIVAGACWRYYPPPDGYGSGNARYSEDGGKTWKPFPSKPFPEAKDGRIAVSSNNPDHIVWIPRFDQQTSVYYTKDRGKTWHRSQGSPVGLIWPDLVFTFYKPLAADRVLPDTFYLYDKRNGRFYRSQDGGVRWFHIATLPAQGDPHYFRHRVLTLPYRAGHIFLSLQDKGLFYSQNGGETWYQITEVEIAESIGAGKPISPSHPPILWLLGKIRGDNDPALSVYRSEDLGKSWSRIDNDSLGWPSESIITGDRQIPNRVFVGTNGRGIFCATPTNYSTK